MQADAGRIQRENSSPILFPRVIQSGKNQRTGLERNSKSFFPRTLALDLAGTSRNPFFHTTRNPFFHTMIVHAGPQLCNSGP